MKRTGILLALVALLALGTTLPPDLAQPGDSVADQCGTLFVNVTVVAGTITADCATLTATATATPTPSATATTTASPTPSATATATSTPTPTLTPTPLTIDWTLPSNGLAVVRCLPGYGAVASQTDAGTVDVFCQALAASPPSVTVVSRAPSPPTTPTVNSPTATASLTATVTATSTITPTVTVPISGTATTPTVYAVTNPNAAPLTTFHTFADQSGAVIYTLVSTIPPRTTATYRVADIPEVPSPFRGIVTVAADAPFTLGGVP